MDNEPKDEKVQVTWDNLNDIRQKFGLALPFNIWNYKKGRVISFFNASLFNRKTWDIKEWKESDLDLCLQITYIKAHPCIDDILKWHNQEQAIQYLKERGIVYW
jgi:hypothetical protein